MNEIYKKTAILGCSTFLSGGNRRVGEKLARSRVILGIIRVYYLNIFLILFVQVFNQYYSMFICLICLYVSMLYRIERQERDNGGRKV